MQQIDEFIRSLSSDTTYKRIQSSSFISTMALALPFVGRCETSKAILNQLHKRITSTSLERSENAVPYIACCGGLGKTRYLYEQQRALLNYCDSDPSKQFALVRSYLADAITVNITFHNGQRLTFAEEQAVRMGESGKQLISSLFAVRILASYLLPDMTISDVIEKFMALNIILTLSLVVEYILVKTQKQMIIIGVDEYTALLRASGTFGRDYLKIIVEDCGSLLCRRDIFVHVLFAGTSSLQFANVFTSSFYVSCKIPMNLLTYEETKQVIDATMQLDDLQNFRHTVQTVGSNIISTVLGGHPRSIEYMFRYFLSCQNDLIFQSASKDLVDSVISRTVLEINSKYPLMTVTDPTMILSHWSLRTPLTRNTIVDIGSKQTTIDDLENEGFVILSSVENNYYIIDLPVAWLYDYSSRLGSKILYFGPLRNLLNILMGKIDWQDLERFGLYYYTLRINSAIMLGRSNMLLTDLLGDVTSLNGSNHNLDLVQIQLPKFPIQITDKLAHKHPETRFFYATSPTAALNTDGAAGDVVFTFPLQFDMFIQTKLTRSSKKEITNTLIKYEVTKMIKAIQVGEKEESYRQLPKFYLILTNLDWPEAVDKVPVQQNFFSFKVSRSDLPKVYGSAMAGRLLIC
jgi:hypothetical protein